MNYRFLVTGLLTAVVAAGGCNQSEPLSSESLSSETGPNLTGAPGTPVMFEVDLAPGVPVNFPECLRVTDKGTTHFHKCEFLGSVSGDFDGAVAWTVNGKQDSQGNGTGGGPFILTGTWNGPSGDLTGTFEGHVEVKFNLGIGSGKLHARGTAGDLLGLQLWADVQEQGPPPGNFVSTVIGNIR